jgi:hypothetical protein
VRKALKLADPLRYMPADLIVPELHRSQLVAVLQFVGYFTCVEAEVVIQQV